MFESEFIGKYPKGQTLWAKLLHRDSVNLARPPDLAISKIETHCVEASEGPEFFSESLRRALAACMTRALAMGIRPRISRSSSASTLSLDIASVRPVEQVIRPAFELGRVSHHAS